MHVGSIIEAHLLRAKDGGQDDRINRVKVRKEKGNGGKIRELANWRNSELGLPLSAGSLGWLLTITWCLFPFGSAPLRACPELVERGRPWLI